MRLLGKRTLDQEEPKNVQHRGMKGMFAEGNVGGLN